MVNMLKLKLTSVLNQISEEGLNTVWAANGVINNDPLTVAIIGDFGCSVANLMMVGETYTVKGHFKEAPDLGYDKIFIITDIVIDPVDRKGKHINLYA
jgi:hypothetical protein